ncbi:MAG: winged helix-turn-helix domain-containing protein [Nitrospinales bacterium]
MPTSEKSEIRCRPRFRITVGKDIALGPGKISLLEAIDLKGSISAGAREIGMSYRRAWQMVNTINNCFKNPLVEGMKGGKGGGGAIVTAEGKQVIELYRSMENKANKSIKTEWNSIRKLL